MFKLICYFLGHKPGKSKDGWVGTWCNRCVKLLALPNWTTGPLNIKVENPRLCKKCEEEKA